MEIKKAANYNSKIFTNRRNTTFKSPQKWDVIVNHITEGYMPGTLTWLENPEAKVSCHYLVTRKGEIYQLADLQHGTWHAVKHSPSARIVQERSEPPNLYTVGIEHEGIHEETQGRLTAAQYAATLELHKHIIERYEATFKEPFLIDREHVLGHHELDTVNRSVTDPGVEFPWAELLTNLTVWNKKRQEAIEMEENKLDTAQQWAVDNSLVKDEGWKGPISKHTMVSILYALIKRVFKM
ncbi:N-acetylmuramoyl-L-alanine amidase [Proteiniclasticum sp. QWL-01]|uniref:N-acetylmuramoyl-L-alanine amidase n=1 Tax=Proteiniclasticum sp. QWL-01 TaxID=3036945 RepID=UPI00240F7351|nr:N-acetylmuramoyl-L-alanine amidase [Proteiniclasticum sp. QWL-01]WFF72660.1 N-acetylmuramoyl-L-alanine amidase [Proteiniclasticum sp. QWL-01]